MNIVRVIPSLLSHGAKASQITLEYLSSQSLLMFAAKVASKTSKASCQECRGYRARLKAEDPAKNEERRHKNHANTKKWRDSLGPEEKERQKELSRLRQQKRRQKLKEIKKDRQSAKSKPIAQSTPTRSSLMMDWACKNFNQSINLCLGLYAKLQITILTVSMIPLYWSCGRSNLLGLLWKSGNLWQQQMCLV
ncbi:hypothetical protein ElyMa_001532800 [Elysia marginata]|uniref:BZIP domain-containing protein n=1 Tax=Elysia marginata TaxID=1093978 RepID=A0AAV4J7T9_9GAST|nr:hypothetical protein ElyMa_001532800 [Elysia marginata]